MVGWHNTPWMWLSMLVFWALLIAVVSVAYRASRSPSGSPRGPGAAEILEQRLARGEISPEDYRDRLAALDGAGKPKPRT